MSKGLVFIHQAPSALLAHIEWTISGVCGAPIIISWHALPAPGKGFRALALWEAPAGAGAVLATSFMNLKQISFEVIQQDSPDIAGYRWSYTPTLGMFSSATDEAGNILVSENQLRHIVDSCGSNGLKLQAELRKVLGQAFDDELESYRELFDGAESNNSVVTSETERVSYGQNVRPL
jgi:hypothetical protein